MNSYKDLKTTRYINDSDFVEKEYQNRLNYPSTFSFDLTPTMMDYRKSLSAGKKYKIFFVANTDILRLLDAINQKSKKILDITHSEFFPRLARQNYFNKLLENEIQNTNEIEGVNSTRHEIRTAIDSNSKEGFNKKKYRFKSLVKMYGSIYIGKEFELKNLDDIRSLYDDLLMDEISEDNRPDGVRFRNKEVYVQDSLGDKKSLIALSDEKLINNQLELWIEFINRSDIPSVLKSIVAHFFFENTHPFYDGNGRMGRFIMSQYLSRKLDPFTGVNISTIIRKNRSSYYKFFEQADDVLNRAELTFFINFFLEAISEGQDEIIRETENLTDKFKDSLGNIDKKFDQDSVQNYILRLLVQDKLFLPEGVYILTQDAIIEMATSKHFFNKTAIKTAIKELHKSGDISFVSQRPIKPTINDLFISN